MAPDAAPPTKKAATIAPHRAIVGGPALRAKSPKFMMRRSPPTASTSGKTSLPADPYAIAADANPAKTALALVSGGVGGLQTRQRRRVARAPRAERRRREGWGHENREREHRPARVGVRSPPRASRRDA